MSQPTSLSDLSQDEQDAYHARTNAALAANGVSTETTVEADYFGFDETLQWYFPDEKQNISFKKMTEGMRRLYQTKTNHSVTLKKGTGDADMKIDPAGDRAALIDVCVVDWYVLKDGKPVGFRDSRFGFKKWLEGANPEFVEALERAIRKSNPWMEADQSSEDIRTQITDLEEKEAKAIKREETERTFLSK